MRGLPGLGSGSLFFHRTFKVISAQVSERIELLIISFALMLF